MKKTDPKTNIMHFGKTMNHVKKMFKKTMNSKEIYLTKEEIFADYTTRNDSYIN